VGQVSVCRSLWLADLIVGETADAIHVLQASLRFAALCDEHPAFVPHYREEDTGSIPY